MREAGGARRAERRRRQLRRVLVWAIPVLVFVVAAAIGPIVVAYDPVTTHTAERLKPPGSVLESGTLALLGTDQVGRDMYAQVLQGARISLRWWRAGRSWPRASLAWW